MEEIIEKTKSLSWNDLSGMLKANRNRANLINQASLVGRLVLKKIHPPHILHPFIRTGWRFLSDIKIEDAGPNRFLFSFSSMEDKEHIFREGPWNFNGSYMILKEWNPKESLEEVDLSVVEFWVQIHGLPLELVDADNARLIGCKLGEVLELDPVEEHASFIRIKIRFHVSTPLEPGFYFPRDNGDDLWIGFKYERLSSFCIHCGLMDHTIGTCYQNPAHPQNYALTDKMRGFPPPPNVDQMSESSPRETWQDSRWTAPMKIHSIRASKEGKKQCPVPRRQATEKVAGAPSEQGQSLTPFPEAPEVSMESKKLHAQNLGCWRNADLLAFPIVSDQKSGIDCCFKSPNDIGENQTKYPAFVATSRSQLEVSREMLGILNLGQTGPNELQWTKDIEMGKWAMGSPPNSSHGNSAEMVQLDREEEAHVPSGGNGIKRILEHPEMQMGLSPKRGKDGSMGPKLQSELLLVDLFKVGEAGTPTTSIQKRTPKTKRIKRKVGTAGLASSSIVNNVLSKAEEAGQPMPPISPCS